MAKIKIKIGNEMPEEEGMGGMEGTEGGMSKEEHGVHMDTMIAGIKEAIASIERGETDKAVDALTGLLGEEQAEKEAEQPAEAPQPSFREAMKAKMYPKVETE